MQLPREVIIGNGTLGKVPEVVKRLNIRGPALIVAGQRSCEIAGNTVRNLLVKEGLTVDTILIETSTFRDVLRVEETIADLKPQILFGVGGGTKIDAAKLSSAHQSIPFISVPTTLSHDGIASPLASVKGFGKPYSAMSQAPLAIIADTQVISQEPWRFVVSGFGDVISKFTAVKDWRLAHTERGEYYGEYAASLALMSATLVEQNACQIQKGSEQSTRILLEALISCGVAMSIAGSSRPCSGSEHLFSHALDIIGGGNAMHGEQCGVGSILMTYLYGEDWKRIRQTLKCLGAPTTAAELGVEDKDVTKALELAATIRPERYTILQKLKMDPDACENAAKATEVIA
jgi:glycerol-1-phosphate dehydrogenase [NAD(P)+]